MKTKTRATDASEFCLVLTPTLGAPFRASQAVMERLTALREETRRDLAAVVTELVTSAVARRPRRPITVTLALGTDAIHGEVSDRGSPAVSAQISNSMSDGSGLALIDRLTSRWAVQEGSTDVWFEMSLGR